jgi:hypothetical protein
MRGGACVAGEDTAHPVSFDPNEAGIGVGAINLLLGDELVAQHNADRVDRRARVVFLGHAIDGDFSHLFAIDDMDNEHFLVTGDAMRIYPEGFPLVLKLAYHFRPAYFLTF